MKRRTKGKESRGRGKREGHPQKKDNAAPVLENFTALSFKRRKYQRRGPEESQGK